MLKLYKARFEAYRVRVFDAKFNLSFVVGTEIEEQVQTLAEQFPDNIYYVTEEALA